MLNDHEFWVVKTFLVLFLDSMGLPPPCTEIHSKVVCQSWHTNCCLFNTQRASCFSIHFCSLASLYSDFLHKCHDSIPAFSNNATRFNNQSCKMVSYHERRKISLSVASGCAGAIKVLFVLELECCCLWCFSRRHFFRNKTFGKRVRSSVASAVPRHVSNDRGRTDHRVRAVQSPVRCVQNC